MLALLIALLLPGVCLAESILAANCKTFYCAKKKAMASINCHIQTSNNSVPSCKHVSYIFINKNTTNVYHDFKNSLPLNSSDFQVSFQIHEGKYYANNSKAIRYKLNGVYPETNTTKANCTRTVNLQSLNVTFPLNNTYLAFVPKSQLLRGSLVELSMLFGDALSLEDVYFTPNNSIPWSVKGRSTIKNVVLSVPQCSSNQSAYGSFYLCLGSIKNTTDPFYRNCNPVARLREVSSSYSSSASVFATTSSSVANYVPMTSATIPSIATSNTALGTSSKSSTTTSSSSTTTISSSTTTSSSSTTTSSSSTTTLSSTSPPSEATHQSKPKIPNSNWPAKFFAPYIYMVADPQFNAADLVSQGFSKYFTFAFITADYNNNPVWGSTPVSSKPYKPQIDQIRSKNGDVIFSIGGYGAVEFAQKESDETKLEAIYSGIIDAYGVTYLDFDIESGALSDTGSHPRRARALKNIKQKYPNLKIQFTVPVAIYGLTGDVISFLKVSKDNGLEIDVVNIMTMDYYDYNAETTNSMSSLAIKSAKSTYQFLQSNGFKSTVGITPMIGQNDDKYGYFKLSDAEPLVQFAQNNNWVSLLSFWSMNRDHYTPGDMQSSSNVQQNPFDFTKLFNKL